MCRHAAYVGPPLGLADFLIHPSHSLVEQSYRPREMLTASLNADGFGIGWYLADGRAGLYTNPMPIWSDANLGHLGRALTSGLWIANVRSATTGQAVNQANTHPFLVDDLLFSHNGFIHRFADGARAALRRRLAPEHEARIQGSTDSEHLFALLRQELAAGDGVPAAFARLFAAVEEILAPADEAPRHGLFNLMISDGRRVHATRHAIRHAAPSLYVGRDEDLFAGGWLVASEPLTDDGDWQAVPEHHRVMLEAGREPEIRPL